MLRSLGRRAWSWAAGTNPWTNVYGLARTLLALGTALTLIFNEPNLLFRPGSGVVEYPVCESPWTFGVFCLGSAKLGLMRWIAAAVLLVVASGWRPRWTAIPHWWISFSLQTSAITLDGGDQVAAVLTLLLLPIALTDNRRWHWQHLDSAIPLSPAIIARRLVALSAVFVIRIQVAAIYLHAAVAKWSVEEWSDGTILYYWFNDPFIGAPTWLKPFIIPLSTSRLVALFTWGSILLELLLFMALVMPKNRWRIMLIAGILFHAAIAVTMGLISFGLSMAAALVLYLRPAEMEFSFNSIKIAVPQWLKWVRGGGRGQPQQQEGVPATSGL